MVIRAIRHIFCIGIGVLVYYFCFFGLMARGDINTFMYLVALFAFAFSTIDIVTNQKEIIQFPRMFILYVWVFLVFPFVAFYVEDK